MPEQPTMAELRDRVAKCSQHFGGKIPREVAVAWDGYFAALLEWGLLSPAQHDELLDLLPKHSDSPVLGIFLGFDSLHRQD